MRSAKTCWLALAVALVALAAGPLAAADAPAEAPPPAADAPPPAADAPPTTAEAPPATAKDETSGFTQDLLADFERAGEQLLALAGAVPADKYSWRPADGVRSVSEVYMHIVGTNIIIPASLGAAPPEGITLPEQPFDLAAEWEKTVTTKDEVIARLRDSIEYAKQAIPQIQDLGAESDVFGFPASKRAYLLIAVTHAHEHLGQSIAYARMNGVVPPWSATTSEGEGDAEGAEQ